MSLVIRSLRIVCADLQRIFQATIDEVREEDAENVNDADNQAGIWDLGFERAREGRCLGLASTR